MLTVFGALIVALTIIGFVFFVLFIRNPASPAWVRTGAVGGTAAMALMILAVGGLIAMVKGLQSQTGGDPMEWVLIAVIAVGTTIGLQRLHMGRRLAAFEVESRRQS